MLPNLQISKQDQAGMTALHYSAQQGHVDVCRTLLTCGADPGITNHQGLTVVQVASDTIQQLLREEPALSAADIEAQLLDAAKNGDIGTVKVSLSLSLLDSYTLLLFFYRDCYHRRMSTVVI